MRTLRWVAATTMIVVSAAPLVAQSPEALAMIGKLRLLQLDRLGNAQIKSDAIPPVTTPTEAAMNGSTAKKPTLIQGIWRSVAR